MMGFKDSVSHLKIFKKTLYASSIDGTLKQFDIRKKEIRIDKA